MVMLTDEALAELAKIENKIGDYICRLCCQKFSNAFSLALHRCSKIVHVVHRCPECAKVFNCPANLASHRRWHKPRSSLGGMKEVIGKEEGEVFDEEDGDFIDIGEDEGSSSCPTMVMVNSPISNGSASPSSQPLPSQPQPRLRPPPLQSPPPPKRTKTVCVTGTVKIESQETPSGKLSAPTDSVTVIPSPIPLISKSSKKLPPVKSPIKSPIRSTYKPSPLCSLSPPPSKIRQPLPLAKYSLTTNSSNTFINNNNGSNGPTIDEPEDLPLALTSPTTPASSTSPISPSSAPPSGLISPSSSTPPQESNRSPNNKSRPIMETMGSTSSSSPSPPPPPTPPSSTSHQINTPTTPPPTPPPTHHQQQNQQQPSSTSSTTIIGEMTTITKEPLFGWTYYPKKFRRQAYMRIKHCCP